MFSLDVWCDVLVCGVVSGLACIPLHMASFFCPSTLVFLTIWAALAAVCLIRPIFKVSPTGKAVLITGCDTGFGFALALRLDSMGFRVIAGCLDEKGEGAKKMKSSSSSLLTCIQLDVTQAPQIKAAVDQVKRIIQEGEVLWGVVNNAGISTFGEVEWVPVDTYKKLLEVNVMGTIATTKAFLPLIRKAKGRIVNIASMLGRMGSGMRSPYVTSKYAIEGFSECLRHEMLAWGVKVCIIEPGNYVAATSIFTDESVKRMGESMWAGMGEDVRQDYGRGYFEETVKTMMSYTNCGITDISEVIAAQVNALTDKFPRSRYLPMDVRTRLRIAVATHMYSWVYDCLYAASHR